MIGNFIRNVIVPEKVGGYYVVPTRIIGFDIGTTEVRATKILLKGTTVAIEKTIVELLGPNTSIPHDQVVVEAIKKIIKQMGPYNLIRSSLSSSIALFKELTLPFIDHDKIKMILAYEIEQFLPFALSELIIDFIITATDKQRQTATIFATAIKKEYIAAHIALFQAAGITSDCITIDLFDLYGLYTLIPTYTQQFNSCALVDIGLHATRIVYIADNTLRAIRIIPKGMSFYAKRIAQDVALHPQQAFEQLQQWELNTNNQQNDSESIKLFKIFFEDIQFTVMAFEKKFNNDKKTDHLLTLGFGQLPYITEYATQQMAISCNSFNVNELFKNKQIKTSTKNHLPQEATYSIACALIAPIMQYFNLRQEEFKPSTEKVFLKQLITTLTLVFLIIVSLCMHTFIQRWRLNSTLQSIQQQIVSALYSHDLTDKQEAVQAGEAIAEAEAKVDTEKEVWFAFSSQARFSFLKYLHALSIAIDKKSTGLKLTRLQITYNKIIFDGEVPDFEKLALFDKELAESPAFNFKTAIPNIKFSNIEVTIKKDSEVAS